MYVLIVRLNQVAYNIGCWEWFLLEKPFCGCFYRQIWLPFKASKLEEENVHTMKQACRWNGFVERRKNFVNLHIMIGNFHIKLINAKIPWMLYRKKLEEDKFIKEEEKLTCGFHELFFSRHISLLKNNSWNSHGSRLGSRPW